MVTVNLVLLVLALLAFFLSAVGVSAPRINLESLGLGFVTLALILHPR